MNSLRPSVRGLDTEQAQLVKAYCALKVVQQINTDDMGFYPLWVVAMLGKVREHMTDEARLRCSQAERRYYAEHADA
jgi:hypothetical protein